MNANCADVGNGIFVGDFRACDQSGPSFDRVVHVWKHGDVAARATCGTCLAHTWINGVTVNWTEGEPVSRLTIPMADLMRLFADEGRMLIHCSAGLCRSATLAIAAKAARGVNPFDALHQVAEALWRQRRVMPEFRHSTITSLMEYLETCSL